ncbi:MAG: hypothetical protein D6772_06670, partial [Bacteroidetes bacterium]
FNYDRLEAVFATVEYTFDPLLIARHYRHALARRAAVDIRTYHAIQAAASVGTSWEVAIRNLATTKVDKVQAAQVINATYSAVNAVNQQFGQEPLSLMHEISEMAFVTSPQFHKTGLTVMDGPFASIMPYGKTGLLSLSSVAYTHHKVSYEAQPTFDCQSQRADCRPDFPSICNYCAVRPRSNYAKMEAQIRQYLSKEVDLHYFTSMFTIKSKLRANYIDDGRPTEIRLLQRNPHFYCIFAGKINSIYEIEKVVEL